MSKPLFTGVCTALVTPFLKEYVNDPLLERLIKRQEQAGVRALVLSGTTGEAPTLSDKEKLSLFEKAKKLASPDTCIIAGTGSNNTEHAVKLSIQAQQAGADALLVVSPYYNKADNEGLYTHFLSIANAVSIPMIVYNVPSRTGLDIPVEVYARLSANGNIIGVKEASTDLTKLTRIRQSCGPAFSIWSGNDDQAVAAISLGAKGVISVVSNVAPMHTQAMCQAALDADADTALALHERLYPLVQALFSEVNPIPVKEAMRLIGYDCGQCRLPLGRATEALRQKLQKLLKS